MGVSINVLLVDDHKMLREGIKQLIEFDKEISVLGQASSGAEARLLLRSLENIGVVVLDINLPDISGTVLLRELKRNYPSTKFLMLTVHNEVEYLEESLNNGVDGYILKETDSSELIKAIKSVYSGERYIQPELIPALNSRLIRREEERVKSLEITKREEQILISIAKGKANKDIAEEFDISERTVKNHITNLFKKIGVSDRTQAAVYAIKNDFIKL